MQEDAPNVLFELLHSQLVAHVYSGEEDLQVSQDHNLVCSFFCNYCAGLQHFLYVG